MAASESLPSVESLHVSYGAREVLRGIDDGGAEREVEEACHGRV